MLCQYDSKSQVGMSCLMRIVNVSPNNNMSFSGTLDRYAPEQMKVMESRAFIPERESKLVRAVTPRVNFFQRFKSLQRKVVNLVYNRDLSLSGKLDRYTPEQMKMMEERGLISRGESKRINKLTRRVNFFDRFRPLSFMKHAMIDLYATAGFIKRNADSDDAKRYYDTVRKPILTFNKKRSEELYQMLHNPEYAKDFEHLDAKQKAKQACVEVFNKEIPPRPRYKTYLRESSYKNSAQIEAEALLNIDIKKQKLGRLEVPLRVKYDILSEYIKSNIHEEANVAGEIAARGTKAATKLTENQKTILQSLFPDGYFDLAKVHRKLHDRMIATLLDYRQLLGRHLKLLR